MTMPKVPRITQKDLQEADDLDFTEEREYWNTYKLQDGETLKIKLVLRGVKRLKKLKPDGTPIYLISCTNVVRVIGIPEKLKAKPKVSAFQPV